MAKRIVIADDSATIQRAFAMTFRAEEVTLVAARSADEGLTLTRQIHADLVIADGMMPDRSGYDLCAAIKSEPALRSIPVYILTSAQQPYDDSRGRQCGAEGYFSKPFDTAVIIEQVHLALAKGPSFDAGSAPLPPPRVPPPSNRGLPMPLEGQPTLPYYTSAPLATDDDEYGEISVDTSPPYADLGEAPLEYLPEPPAASLATATASPLAASALSPAPSLSTAKTPGPVPWTGAPEIVVPALVPATAAVLAPATADAAPHTPAPVSPAALFPPPPAVSAPASMRPSLIPGIRPGALAPARPGAVPARPAGVAAPPPSRPPAPVSRTLMGLPAANLPIPGSVRAGAPTVARTVSVTSGAASARSGVATGPGATPAPQLTPLPSLITPPITDTAGAPGVDPGDAASDAATPPLSTTVSSLVSQAIGSAVDQKMASIAARGPEYEAIARLSRAIIEEIVWEIVPELAEVIIREQVREHLDKQGRNQVEA